MIWDFQHLLSRRLMMWSLASMLAGIILLAGTDEFWKGFGLQALVWGFIDGLIGLVGLRGSLGRLFKPVDLAEAGERSRKLRKILWINTVLDVGYIAAGGLLLALRGGEDVFLAGSGIGIMVQGGFLFLFDLIHALRVPVERLLPDLNILAGEEHDTTTLAGYRGAVLVVHGFPGSPEEVRPIAEALNRQGWTVRLLRLPGHGVDYRGLLQTRAPQWEQTVSEELRELQKRCTPVLLCGYSLGGGLSVCAAADYPPDGLILLSPYWIPETWWMKTLIFLLRPFAPAGFPPFRFRRWIDMNQLSDAAGGLLPDIDLNSAEAIRLMEQIHIPVIFLEQFRWLSRKVKAAAKKIHLPVIIIQGKDDPVVRPSGSRKLAEWMGEQVEYVEVPGDHAINRVTNPGYSQAERAALAFSARFIHTD